LASITAIPSTTTLPPLCLVDLIVVVKTTPSSAVQTETLRLLNTHTVLMSPDQLYSHLYCLHALSRNLGHTLQEMVSSHCSAGADNDEMAAVMLRAYDDLVEDHLDM